MNFKESITKLQNLPENKKKIILWTIVVILGLIMAYFWINASIKRLSEVNLDDSFGKLGDTLSDVKLPEIPDLDITGTTTPSNQEIINK